MAAVQQASTFFSPGGIMKEYEIIMLKYNEKHVGYIYYVLVTCGYNSLGDPTRQHEV